MEIPNTILSGIALLASIYAIYSTKIDVKKQLRLNKLEEILEIVLFMQGYYRSVFILFSDFKNFKETTVQDQKSKLRVQECIMRQNEFKEIVTPDMIISKTARLTTLSNAYLPNTNNLKFKVNTLATLYYNMYQFISRQGNMPIVEELTIIPKPGEMDRFIMKIERQVIEEMKLGYKAARKKDHQEYFRKRFKDEIEINSNDR